MLKMGRRAVLFKENNICWSRTSDKRKGGRNESRTENRSRRGDAEKRGRGDAEAKAKQNRQSRAMKESEERVGTRWKARSYIGARKCACWRSPRARSERRTSSASNAAHSSGSREQWHKARAFTTPLTQRTASVRRIQNAPLNEGAYISKRPSSLNFETKNVPNISMFLH